MSLDVCMAEKKTPGAMICPGAFFKAFSPKDKKHKVI